MAYGWNECATLCIPNAEFDEPNDGNLAFMKNIIFPRTDRSDLI